MSAAHRPLGSRYRLVERIGSGGMGTVWRGVGPDGEPVAIKLLHQHLALDPEVVARFVAERAILTGVHHPNLVPVRDLVVDGDDLGIVMELVDGPDLRQVLTTHATLAPADATRIVRELCGALDVIHARGIVHRDLKPENILITSADPATAEPRLTDFGVARITDSARMSTALVGTPTYMAPELMDGRAPTPRSDLYAVGVLLYELVTGVPPFCGDSPMAVLHQHATAQPGRPEVFPDALWPVVEMLLAKDPARRFGSAAALAAALASVEPALTGIPAMTPLTAAPVGAAVRDEALATPAAAYAPSVGAAAPADHAGATAAPTRTRRSPWLLAIPLALAALGVGGYALTRQADTPAPVAAVTSTLTAAPSTAPASSTAPTPSASGTTTTPTSAPTVPSPTVTRSPAPSGIVPGVPVPARTVTVTATPSATSTPVVTRTPKVDVPADCPLEGQPDEALVTAVDGPGWLVVLASYRKSDLNLPSAFCRAHRLGVSLVDTDATRGLTPGIWAAAEPTVYSTREQAEAQCHRLGRRVPSACNPRQIG